MLLDLLRQLLAAQPFVPVTLHFSAGDQLDIHDPAKVLWPADGPLVVCISARPYAGSHTVREYAHHIDPRAILRIVTAAIPPALIPPEPEPLPPAKEKALFVCTHNSARSQMAEAILRQMASDRFEAASAGLEVGAVHPLAVQVMQEIGIDISAARSKTIFDLYRAGHLFNAIISVCDDSREKCPVFPGVRSTLHWSIPDPTVGALEPDAMLARFRIARDALYTHIRDWLDQE